MQWNFNGQGTLSLWPDIAGCDISMTAHRFVEWATNIQRNLLEIAVVSKPTSLGII